MKKIFLTFGIVISGMLFVNAQNIVSNDPSTKIMDHLTTICGITPEQTAKIKPIADALVKARQDDQKKYAGNPAGLKAADKSVNESFKAKLRTILTSDQMTKLEAAQSKRMKYSSAPKAVGKE